MRSILTAPARGRHGERSQDLHAQMLGNMRGAQGPAEAFADEPDLFRSLLDRFAFACDHGVDGGADPFRDALRRADIGGGRRLVEDGKRAFGRGARWRDVFHGRTMGAWRGGATHYA
jgi:hypothetical protein